MNFLQQKGGILVLSDWPEVKQFNYKGFDGKSVWDGIENEEIKLHNGLVPLNELEKVLIYKNKVSSSRLIYLSWEEDEEINNLNSSFQFCGFDYGNYISETNYYSLICHEVLLGSKPEFQSFKPYLNKNSLLNDLDTIQNLEDVKKTMRQEENDVEEEVKGEEFNPIKIYLYNE